MNTIKMHEKEYEVKAKFLLTEGKAAVDFLVENNLKDLGYHVIGQDHSNIYVGKLLETPIEEESYDFNHTFKVSLSADAILELCGGDNSQKVKCIEGMITHIGKGSGVHCEFDTDSSLILIDGKKEEELSDDVYFSFSTELKSYLHGKAMNLHEDIMKISAEEKTTIELTSKKLSTLTDEYAYKQSCSFEGNDDIDEFYGHIIGFDSFDDGEIYATLKDEKDNSYDIAWKELSDCEFDEDSYIE